MNYFSNTPKIDYRFPDGKVLNSTAIFVRPDVNVDQVLNNPVSKYTISDGKSPDSLSRDVYNDSTLFYSILLANNIFDFYKDWPAAYSSWLNELYLVNSQFTFYSRYNFDIQVNDLVCKYLPTSTTKFDQSNYGIVTDINTFHRSFDVEMIAGEIMENQDYIVVRKSGNSFKIIKPIETSEYQSLIKKVEKVDSVFVFEKQDPLSAEFGLISPYYKSDGSIGDDAVVDLAETPDVILWRYMNDNLPSDTKVISFKQNKENEWLFNKNIIIIPKANIDQFLNLITASIDEQKVIFE